MEEENNGRKLRHFFMGNMWPSFIDIIISCFAIFIFFTVAHFLISQENFTILILKSRQSQFQNDFQSKYEGIFNTRTDEKISFSIDGSIQRISFADNLLFKSGGTELLDEGKNLLDFCAKTFTETKDKNGELIYDKIQVEGYTDKVPVDNANLHRQGIKSNWELSAIRSINVVKYLISQGVPPSLLSGVGYGEHQAKAKRTDSNEKRRQDRKIEIALFYSLEEDDEENNEEEDKDLDLKIIYDEDKEVNIKKTSNKEKKNNKNK